MSFPFKIKIKIKMKILSFIFIFIFMLFITTTTSSITTLPSFPTTTTTPPPPPPPLGWWTLLQPSIGISAMHMQLLFSDSLIIFDRTDDGRVVVNHSHSVLFDLLSNSFRPLTLLSDTFCSSASVTPSGSLLQTGGYHLGSRSIRSFTPCPSCDWVELAGPTLAAPRWYASNHLLPDGRVIVVGGRGSHSYEFLPKNGPTTNNKAFFLRFLKETWDGRNNENNLYPFLHLLPNGNLFIFANNRSIEFNYFTGKVAREFPSMPTSDRRNYPSTGSSTVLPLLLNNATTLDYEILICGGAHPDSFNLADVENIYVAASRTCGRMRVSDKDPKWVMEVMPMPRVMPDMVVLPTGDVLLINGAGNGTAGWGNADNPVLNPVLYRTYESDPARRFVVLNPSGRPRMYHSSAVVVADGRVVVGGSNPNPNYNFTAKYPTELSLEAFSPPYLDPRYSVFRPAVLAVETEGKVVVYGQEVPVTFGLGAYRPELGVAVTMLMPPFATHSFGMNQRLLVLGGGQRVEQLSAFAYKVTVRAPVDANVALPGYYMLFVVHAGVPSHGVWIQLRRSAF